MMGDRSASSGDTGIDLDRTMKYAVITSATITSAAALTQVVGSKIDFSLTISLSIAILISITALAR